MRVAGRDAGGWFWGYARCRHRQLRVLSAWSMSLGMLVLPQRSAEAEKRERGKKDPGLVSCHLTERRVDWLNKVDGDHLQHDRRRDIVTLPAHCQGLGSP